MKISNIKLNNLPAKMAILLAIFAVAFLGFYKISANTNTAFACGSGCGGWGHDWEEDVPELDGYCYADPNYAETGDTIAWVAGAEGGDWDYSYSWSGTDGLSGNSDYIYKTYSTSGTKNASVTISSNGESIVRTCYTVIEKEPLPDLSIACSPDGDTYNVGDRVSWSVDSSGGDGNYRYSWSGTDSLSSSSQNISKTYSTAGTKNARVTVTSDGQSVSDSCTVYVEKQVNNLSISCTPDNETFDVDETVRWDVSVSGGESSYTYRWSGTDSLSSFSKSVSKKYTNDGTKNANIEVQSRDGQTAFASCQVDIEEEELDVSCTPDDDTFDVGERVTWRVTARGGSGNYDYDWDGTDGLSGSGRSESITYDTDGRKRADVDVEDSRGNRGSATCRIDVEGDNRTPTVSVTSTTGGQVAGVFLSQVPYTGLSDNPILNFLLYSLGGLTLLVMLVTLTFVLRRRYANKYGEATSNSYMV